VIVEGAKAIVPWVPRSSRFASSESRTVSSDVPAQVRLVARRGDTPGENERGVDLLQGAQPALRRPYRPPHGGLEQFARHRLIQPTGLVKPTRQHLSETPPAELGQRIAGNMVGPWRRHEAGGRRSVGFPCSDHAPLAYCGPRSLGRSVGGTRPSGTRRTLIEVGIVDTDK